MLFKLFPQTKNEEKKDEEKELENGSVKKVLFRIFFHLILGRICHRQAHPLVSAINFEVPMNFSLIYITIMLLYNTILI